MKDIIRRGLLLLTVTLGICLTALLSAQVHADDAEPVQSGTVLSADFQSADIWASGLTADADVSFRAAVWSDENGQDDLRWYDLALQEDALWHASCSLRIHNSAGSYQVHVYRKENETMTFLAGHSFLVPDTGCAEVSAVQQDTGRDTCSVLIRDVFCPFGVDAVRVAVWSQSNQSDLVWYDAVPSSEDDWEAGVDVSKHGSRTGMYNAHVYLRDGNRTLRFIGSAEIYLEASVPTCEAMTVSQDNDTGDFTIELTGVRFRGEIDRVLIPTWNRSDQSDICWYEVPDDGTGTYTVHSNISKHRYHYGKYQAHAYIKDRNGRMYFVNGTEFSVTADDMKLSVGESQDECIYPLLLTNLHGMTDMKKVMFGVWSEQGGQDDLKWYSGRKTGDSTYTAEADIRNHKTKGRYQIHVYGEMSDGTMVFLTSGDQLEIRTGAAADVSVVNADHTDGSFEVRIQPKQQTSAVDSFSVPVWCASDQSDIYWYKAQQKSDGTWTVKVRTANHKEHSGNYSIHVYASFANGIFDFAGSANQKMTLKPLSVRSDAGNGKRKMVIKGVPDNAGWVKVAVWSDQNGQDDLVWYPASRDADGLWSALMNIGNHLNSGKMIAHVYSDGAFIDGDEFEIPYNEIKNAGTETASGLSCAQDTDQLILVSASGTAAKVSMLNKNEDGTWFRLFETNGYVGRGGVGETTEWNGRTPPGVYGFTVAFGIKPDPGCRAFGYTQVDSTYYWVDDVYSPYYNKFVTTRTTPKNWSSAEHLIDYTQSYAYSIAIDYNPECTPGVGSAIFLHCSAGRATGGCVAVPEDVMVRILQNLRSDCRIVIDNAENLANH